MFHIALYEPEIPPNTGNIIRLCANTGSTLHLIEPLGFSLDEKKLRRAGLDYREFADIRCHANLDAMLETLPDKRLVALSSKVSRHHGDFVFQDEDILLFGPESRGLPAALLATLSDKHKLRIPMMPGSRSLNLSNAVSVVLYEALRQQGFPGML
ncbi:tRNA (cytidine(34)-2'-O)-methyltransferase [Alcanivorax sp. 1008]|uniref:tRNA (cytidine(34)-2'-O)-methyltransferase n=1 Tax=Alcanivorax sp. 1008 TaxID=2816853 RepID=UPI001D793224|nr:tRNA (cytidine(34)-2'-O)-methyltransferase [Alcanivorax sp. 1008]MCC1495797.1 tRNA (cytidine(34)-2'-O)-methyltransferase [Alcanivorax sp. 1008]